MTVGGGKVFHGGPSSNHNDPISWTKGYHSAADDPDDKQHAWKAFTAEELAEAPLQDTRETDHMIKQMKMHFKLG